MGLFSLFSKRQAADPPLEAKSADAARLGALAEWIIGGGGASAAGVEVSPVTAMRFATVYACVRLIAESIAQLPVHLYERGRDGSKNRVVDHPLAAIVSSRPNGWQTSFEYFEFVLSSLCLRGNSFAFIERQHGRLAGLLPIMPGSVTVEQGSDLALRYIVTAGNGSRESFGQGDIHHVRGLTMDGVTGISPITWQRNTIGLAMAAEKHGSVLFKNGARPGGLLAHPGALSDEAYARIRRSWQETHGGDKQGGTAILEEGLKYEPITMSNEDAQYLEVRQFQQLRDLQRVPGTAAHDRRPDQVEFLEHHPAVAGDGEIRFLPWCRRLEAAINRDLLDDRDRGRGLYVEFLLDGLERADIETRYKVYNMGIMSGLLSSNECRARENMNPRPGGDVYLQPLNMVNGSEEPLPDATGKGLVRTVPLLLVVAPLLPTAWRPGERLRADFRPRFLALAKGLVSLEVGELRALIGDQVDRDRFATGSAALYARLPEYIRNQFTNLVREYAAAVRAAALGEIDSEATVDLDEFATGILEAFITRHVGSSEGQLADLMENTLDEELGEALGQRLDEWHDTRAGKIAGQEPVQQESAVARFVWAAAGVTRLQWVRRGSNSCPFCKALDGKIVGIEENFLEAGEFTPEGHEASPLKVRGPKLHAPIHRGCVCAIVPVRG